jgi:hypothetical protein
MPSAAARVGDIDAFTAKAASQMAGDERAPPSTTAANAKPDAGQIGDVLALRDARARPSLASAT